MSDDAARQALDEIEQALHALEDVIRDSRRTTDLRMYTAGAVMQQIHASIKMAKPDDDGDDE